MSDIRDGGGIDSGYNGEEVYGNDFLEEREQTHEQAFSAWLEATHDSLTPDYPQVSAVDQQEALEVGVRVQI
jgi:hypothetical protein